GPDPRNFNQRVSLGRNDLLIRTFLRAVNCTLIHENTGFLDSDAQRCAFVCHYSEINQKIRRGRSLVQQADQKPLTQQGLTV
ncbi:hypothetical protein QU967_23095, partial [Escherichia coli]|nr:hypothetical protein [Escherichia coli]MDZ6767563.1 hypothetical protein [Escherichia coli]